MFLFSFQGNIFERLCVLEAKVLHNMRFKLLGIDVAREGSLAHRAQFVVLGGLIPSSVLMFMPECVINLESGLLLMLVLVLVLCHDSRGRVLESAPQRPVLF